MHLPRRDSSSDERFTFVPTLTADDGGPDGGKVSYDREVFRESLYVFMMAQLEAGNRQVSALRSYFERQDFGFEYCAYGDSLDLEFTHEGRQEYFDGIPDEFLQKAVILVDPSRSR